MALETAGLQPGRHRPDHLRHLHAGRHVPGHRLSDPGRASAPATPPPSTSTPPAPASSPRWPPAPSSSTPASTSACSSSAPRCCRASSTGRTAAPASSSATAPARWCWSRARPGGVGPFVLKSDGTGASLLYARGPASSPASVTADRGLLHRHGRPRGLPLRRARHGRGHAPGRSPQAGLTRRRHRPTSSRTRPTSASSPPWPRRWACRRSA